MTRDGFAHRQIIFETGKLQIVRTKDGESGLNYLCRGFKKYFKHAVSKVKKIAAQLKSDPTPTKDRM